MRKGCPDLSLQERQEIFKLRKLGYGIREIGKRIGRSGSAVSREIKRSRGRYSTWGSFAWYEQAKLADNAAKLRRKGKRHRVCILKTPEINDYVYKCIKKSWSPEIVSCRIGRDISGASISHETIYQYIYRCARELIQYLVRKGKTRRVSGKGKTRPLRGRTSPGKSKPGKRSIESRPQAANEREDIGHLETDLIVSPPSKSKSALQVTTDRKLRKTILTLVADRKGDTARRALLQKLIKLEPNERATITADNGPEHSDLPELERVLSNFTTYYCGPYRSWERGTVESINGIIRRWFPKGTDFSKVTDEEVQKVEDWFNNRPMLVLDGLTPNEMHALHTKL